MLVNDLLLLASKGLNNPQAARLTSSISLHFSFQQSNPVFPLAFHSVPWRLTASSLARLPARPPIRGFLNGNEAITKSSLTWAMSSCLPSRHPPQAPPTPQPGDRSMSAGRSGEKTSVWVEGRQAAERHSQLCLCQNCTILVFLFHTLSPLPGKYVSVCFFSLSVAFGRNSWGEARWNVRGDL